MIGHFLRVAGESIDYALAVIKRRHEDRAGFPQLRWWLWPLCWIRGHSWHGWTIQILPWRLQFCMRCGEEIAHRASWKNVESRPMDQDDDWIDYDESEER